VSAFSTGLLAALRHRGTGGDAPSFSGGERVPIGIARTDFAHHAETLRIIVRRNNKAVHRRAIKGRLILGRCDLFTQNSA